MSERHTLKIEFENPADRFRFIGELEEHGVNTTSGLPEEQRDATYSALHLASEFGMELVVTGSVTAIQAAVRKFRERRRTVTTVVLDGQRFDLED